MSAVEEPLSPERLEEITVRAAVVAAAWGSREPVLSDFLSVAAAEGARVAREDVPLLVAELADARAVEVPEQIVHRAEIVVRTMLGQDGTAAAIVQALAAARLLNNQVRPANGGTS
jgi:hypothetical protein